MATIKAIEARSVHQIQSGQVITDLCSVAKELVENSLDAGATTLEIRFKNNGLDLIEVQDNGGGISPENYENVALKHYTSKLSSYDDLASLHTFGFRGEALSSLCALADFQIVTAQANQAPRANRLEFEVSGKLRKTQIVAGQRGTTASVAGIFKRLPVRRRELEKNIKREYGKVLSLLHAYACISTGTTKENITNIYGAKTLAALIPLDLDLEFKPSMPTQRVSGEEQTNRIHVRGHISRPVFGEGRQTPDRQMFFVNSRPCALPQIAKAFNDVYKSFNVSQSPFIFADLQMDTSAYDVNVSPDKRTIMLHDAGAMIESLKISLAQMFEAADQTVPQSQILGSKASGTKQQALGALPGFVTAKQASQDMNEPPATPRREQSRSDVEIPETQQTGQNFIQRVSSPQAGASDTNFPSTPTKPAWETGRQPKPPSRVISPILEEERPSSPRAEPEARDTPDNPDPPQPNAGPEDEMLEHSSQALDISTNPMAETEEETPNVVQNAFDRMRPRRLPAEMATITIGDRVVTSMVGSGHPRKRRSDFGSAAKEPRQSKRKIHKPSRPGIFGDHMKAFAAPGTQADGGDTEVDEEDELVDDVAEEYSEEDASVEAEIEESADDIGEAEDLAPEDGEYVPLETASPRPLENEVNSVDESHTENNGETEEEKKAREDKMVQRLIHQAEETAVVSDENSTARANKMNKGAIHRDTTVNLIGTIDASVSRLQSQITQLRKSLTSQPTSSQPQELAPGDEKTVEDRLSLTVSKADFARMRIVGQFNLGFILAVRPGGDHDELFIIDQHASDEKFNFERLQAETAVQHQRLVRPQRLDLTAVEEEIVIENRAALEKNGFIVTVDESGDEPIGRRCQLVSLPLSKEVVFGSRDLEELIVLLSEAPVTNGASVPRPSKVRKMFAMRACRSSIMIGKTLTTRQMQRVVHNMGTIDKPWNCPHGRPTMRHLISLGQSEAWDEYEELHPDVEIDTDEAQPVGLDVWKRFLEGEKDEESDS
ncbi:hypothetical protein N7468_007186 [Penicillium chermesinum]|uniref:DNA mismatch repair protein PMS1 n=1 Tax=Penicillium chermesinum TaxID=63820 RepID=A0A9W9NTL4_9EURO|nr:uncharacterized protein N7468_007186 [Penicillium chermesinum]KAJ5225961.1 hypothetical protein N7468_007186 [Penicillium chermesinum]